MNYLVLSLLLTMLTASCSEEMDVKTSGVKIDDRESQAEDLTKVEDLRNSEDLAEDLQISNLDDNDEADEEQKVVIIEDTTAIDEESGDIIEITEVEEITLEPESASQPETDTLDTAILEANAPFLDPDNAAYSKIKKRIPDFDTKLDQCIGQYQGIFSAHIKDINECSKLYDRMNKNKFRLVKRCMRLNFQDKLSDEAIDRLERVLPRSIERINRQYRKASLVACNLATIPDQSQVNYVFNSSVEIGELDGKWGVKDGSQIPGWSVRFYDKDKGVVEKKGLLELQSNALYRKSYEGTKDKHYMELDSNCAKGYSCPTTNVSIRQKIFVDAKKDFFLTFEARMRRNDPTDNAIEVKFYKRGSKLDDRKPITAFVIVSEDTDDVAVEEGKSLPTSTEWQLYGTDLGVVEPGQYFIEINEVGKSNRLGTLLDNISINQN